jgi:hypothetical protein
MYSSAAFLGFWVFGIRGVAASPPYVTTTTTTTTTGAWAVASHLALQ